MFSKDLGISSESIGGSQDRQGTRSARRQTKTREQVPAATSVAEQVRASEKETAGLFGCPKVMKWLTSLYGIWDITINPIIVGTIWDNILITSISLLTHIGIGLGEKFTGQFTGTTMKHPYLMVHWIGLREN